MKSYQKSLLYKDHKFGIGCLILKTRKMKKARKKQTSLDFEYCEKYG